MRMYHKGNLFPSEAFVQEAINQYFVKNGFKIDDTGQVDLIAMMESTSEKWVIEAKGATSAVGLDFNTCLGQLLKSMIRDDVNYAVAVPKTAAYKKQCEKLSDYIRIKLSLNIIVVDENGKSEIIRPFSNIANYF